jgi:hypothetical protein
MASTETRTGFRLPWVSDAHQGADTSAEEEQMDPAATDPEPNPAPETVDQLASPPGVATPTPAQAPVHAQAPEPPAPRPARRPTKFLADLARAMHAAAEAERQEILERFQAEAKTFIETIHERSATESAELRASADEDIAGIREWSKAEIARIREVTDQRISDRKSELERASEAQAGRIERQIEHIHGAVGAFEDEMARFFEALLAEEDPSRFADLASNLPEPPSLEAVAAATRNAPPKPLVAEPPTADVIEDRWGAIAAAPGEAAAPGDEQMTADAAEPAEAEAQAEVEPGTAEVEAQAEVEPGTAEVEAQTEAEPATAEMAAELPVEVAEEAAYETQTAEVAGEVAAQAESVATAAAPSFDEDTLQVDPRVAALGLTPDFDAAEAEAAADLSGELTDDGSGEEIAVIDDETIASRLAGLVPAAPSGPSIQVQVVVSGLVSVASIAAFKRGLARLAGVQSVSVASGPDGEFVFTVTGPGDGDLAGSVASLPGFTVDVTGVTGDRIEVVAHDPDAA